MNKFYIDEANIFKKRIKGQHELYKHLVKKLDYYDNKIFVNWLGNNDTYPIKLLITNLKMEAFLNLRDNHYKVAEDDISSIRIYKLYPSFTLWHYGCPLVINDLKYILSLFESNKVPYEI